jgi:hypothetical protein
MIKGAEVYRSQFKLLIKRQTENEEKFFARTCF